MAKNMYGLYCSHFTNTYLNFKGSDVLKPLPVEISQKDRNHSITSRHLIIGKVSCCIYRHRKISRRLSNISYNIQGDIK